MKKALLVLTCLHTFFLGDIWLFGTTALPSMPRRSGQLIVDPYFSPFMGASDLLFGHTLVEEAINGIVPPGVTKHRPNLSQFGRLGELTLYWFFNSFLATTQHEVFGHGYRLRSLGRHTNTRVLSYTITPLGGGTEFDFSPQATEGEWSAGVIAGIEAEEILAQSLKKQWFFPERLNARAASLYSRTRLSPILYSLIGKNDELQQGDQDGHDIKFYVQQLNALYPGLNIKQKNIYSLALVNLLDPTLYNVYYAYYHYFFFGENPWLWSFPLGSMRYLPSFTIFLSPYGPEVGYRNLLKDSKRMYSWYVKAGQLQKTSFGGFGMQIDPVIITKKLSLGMVFDAWSQPNFIDTTPFRKRTSAAPTPSPMSGRLTGAHLGATLQIYNKKITKGRIMLQGGYKMKGYLPGYPLDSSPYVRVGINVFF